MVGRPKTSRKLTHGDRVPAGILFGDMKGSTTAAEENEFAMVQITRQYLALVERTVKSFSPQFFKVKGESDGFMALFPNTIVMVECGMGLKLAIQQRGWKVRLGGHYGEAFEIADGDLIGADMNRAARIASAAEAEICQFLVSDAVPPIVRDRLQAITFKNHGVVKAKGIEQGLMTHEVIRCGESGLRERQREEYLARVADAHQWIDLGGLAPQVGTDLLRISLDDVFIHVFARRDAPKFDHYEREEIRYRRELEHEPDLRDRERRLREAAEKFDARYSKKQEKPERIAVAALSERPRCVVLGDPGAGKTTLLRYLAHRVALRKALDGSDTPLTGAWEDRTPIYVRVGAFATLLAKSPEASLDAFIPAGLGINANPITADLFQHEKTSGRCLFLFDGLDEIVDTKLRQEVRDRVRQFTTDNAACASVVTSRIVGYRDVPLPDDETGFAHFTLCPFDDDEIGRFLVRWYESIAHTGKITDTERQNARVLADGVLKHAGVRRLATNPLLLTLIAIVYWRETKLPRRRIELYRLAATMLLDKWRQVGLDVRESTSILMAIAFEMHATSGVGLITRPELERIVIALKTDPKRGGRSQLDAERETQTFLKLVGEQSGLLYVRGLDDRGSEVFGFLHLTFEEYFAAREFARRWKQAALCLENYLHLPRWREILLLASAHLSDEDDEKASDAFVRKIMEAQSPYDAQLHRDLLLAAHCLADDAVVYEDLRKEIFERIDAAFDSTIDPLNELIGDALSAMAGSQVAARALDLLVTKLGHGYSGVQDAAKDALGKMGETAATPEFLTALAVLLHHENGYIRSAAARAVGRIREITAAPEFLATLLRLLRDEDTGVGLGAAQALGAMGKRGVTSEILTDLAAMLRDERSETRTAASFAFYEMGEGAATPELLMTLAELLHNERLAVRYQATRVVEAMGKRAATPEILTALATLLRDENGSVRIEAAEAIEMMGEIAATPEILAALLGLLRRKEGGYTAARALGLMGESAATPESLTLLARLLRDEDADVRSSGARAVREMGSRAATPEILSALTGLLRDEDSDVREVAADAVRAIGNSAAAPEILSALMGLLGGEYNSTVAWAAAGALGAMAKRTASPEIIAILAGALHDENERVRMRAASVVGEMGAHATPEFITALMGLLRDEYWGVRRVSVQVLSRMGERTATPAFLSDLARLLRDKEEDVRSVAASAVGRMGETAATPEFLTVLAELLRDEHSGVRTNAAKAVREIGEAAAAPEILAALAEMLRDGDGEVRYAAADTVEKMGETAATPEILAALVGLLREDKAVREEATRAVSPMGRLAATPEILTALAELIEETRRSSGSTEVWAFYALMTLASYAPRPAVV